MIEYRDIEGYEGLYQVSNKGTVISVPRLDRLGRKIGGKLLECTRHSGGYLRVCLYKEGTKTYLYVHRLVALAFIGKPEHKDQVNHINGEKADNSAENLEWVTSQENNAHAYVTGLNMQKQWENSSSYKGPIQQIDARTGELVRVIHGGHLALKKLGFTPSSVSACITGKRKSHKGYLFRRD